MRRERLLNLIASSFTVLMGFTHFFVPYFFPWDQYLTDVYPPISWALFAMNFFFSFLLTWAGILTFISLKYQAMRRFVIGGMGAFWIAGGIYELIVPFPLAEAKWILPAISFSIAVLYVIALYLAESSPNSSAKEGL